MLQQTRIITDEDILKKLPEEKKAEYLKNCRKRDRRKRLKRIRHWLFANLFNLVDAAIATAALIIAIIALMK